MIEKCDRKHGVSADGHYFHLDDNSHCGICMKIGACN